MAHFRSLLGMKFSIFHAAAGAGATVGAPLRMLLLLYSAHR